MVFHPADHVHIPSKFFTIVTTINTTMLLLAATNVWDYPRRYTGAFVLGNLFFAILMRNELFGRILYATINCLFAKVNESLPSWHCSLAHLSTNSGRHCGSALAARQLYSIWVVFIRAAHHQVSCGLSSGWSLSSSTTRTTTTQFS